MSKHRQQLEEEVIASIERFQKVWKSYFMPETSALGLTPTQGALLHMVQTHQPLGSRKLGTLLGITPGAVTQLVDTLVDAGYVVRSPNPTDGRAMDLSVTPTGEEILAKLLDKKVALLVTMFSALGDDELLQLLAMHDKMHRRLEDNKL